MGSLVDNSSKFKPFMVEFSAGDNVIKNPFKKKGYHSTTNIFSIWSHSETNSSNNNYESYTSQTESNNSGYKSNINMKSKISNYHQIPIPKNYQKKNYNPNNYSNKSNIIYNNPQYYNKNNSNLKSKSIDCKTKKSNNKYKNNNSSYNNYQVLSAQQNKYSNNYNFNQYKKNNYIIDNSNIDNNLMKFDDVNRNPLYINLLHYDENLTINENQNYYKYFKLNVVGGYYGIDNFDMFIKYIEAINSSKIFLRYILIVSGSNSFKVLNYCYNFKFIHKIIIFCFLENNYKNLLSNKKIELITNSFGKIISYLKNQLYPDEELDMSSQIPTTPLITFYEYKNCYFAIHRMIASFFDENWSKPQFNLYNKCLVSKFLERSNFDIKLKIKINEIMDKLINSKNFTLDCIKYYTGENLCYIFNKTLRDIGKNYDGMSHFVGPFDYALFKFLHDNPSKGLYKNITLYRDVNMNILDSYLYYLSLNDVICLASFTSTSVLKDLNFQSTNNAKLVNNSKNNDLHIKMIFKYKYFYGNVSPGICIQDESSYSYEEEVILFPFTQI